MPKYDLRCEAGHIQADRIVPYGTRPPCPECGAATEIVWMSSFPNVIGDEIIGGFTTDNMTGQNETFYSKSEHRRRVKELGLRIRDEYAPPPGTDKAKHSVRWR